MQDIKKKKGIIPSHPEKKEKRKAAAYVSEKNGKPEWKHKMGKQWITYLMRLWMLWTKSNKDWNYLKPQTVEVVDSHGRPRFEKAFSFY